ncbi:MAG: hypothetical protein QXQ47_03855 [Candidatus Bathyarchaeia archaeon]
MGVGPGEGVVEGVGVATGVPVDVGEGAPKNPPTNKAETATTMQTIITTI